MKKISFVGTGNLASAILKGVVEASLTAPENIFVFDIDKNKTARLNSIYGVNVAENCKSAAENADAVVVAVKPKDVVEVLDVIKPYSSFVISTVAGVDVSSLYSHLDNSCVVFRIMPNINAAVGMAMTAFCCNSNATDEQKSFVERFCLCFGDCMKLDEKLFSVFTALAGSAPAFVYEFINDLAFAGVKNGLSKNDALKIAVQTVLGSAQAVKTLNVHPCELTDRVCSPSGTTVEGVAALREFGFDNAVITAIDRTVEKDIKMKK
ncbi:MAG: pyrroline-5-carboxylate reductase [Clostridia bacterium]|nr:pyrroline-5-carboxylate reductase [Clostridia bacterium]